MAFEGNAGELAAAALSGGGAVELVRLAVDFVKGRKAKRREAEQREEQRAASDAELLHQSEVEFRRALLVRIQQLEEHDAAKSSRIRELEQRDEAKSAKIQQLEEENDRLRTRLRQLEDSHAHE